MLNVKFKRLNEYAQIPTKAHKTDAGFDMVATSVIDTNIGIKCGTGLSIEIPEGYVGKIYPRSSISKTDLMLANSTGIIDCGYTGEIFVMFKYTNAYPPYDVYGVGDRVAQLIIEKLEDINLIEVDELSNSERGDGGFGSTGS